MKFRQFGAALAALALMLGLQPARAAQSTYAVKDGNGTLQQFCEYPILGGSVMAPCHILMGLFGGDPVAINETNTGALDVTIVAGSLGLTGTLPAFAATPTFNCGTGCGGAPTIASGADVVEGTLSDTSTTNSVFGALLAIKAATQDVTTPTPVKVDHTTPDVSDAVTVSDVRPVSGTITAADAASTTVAGMNSVTLVTGSPTTNSAYSQAVNGMSSATITVTGTFVATLQVEASGDGGTTWAPVSGLVRGTSLTTGAITAPTIISIDATGFTNVRARASAYTSGTATAKITFSPAAGMTKILNPGLPGENHLGNVTGQMTFVPTTPTTTAATRASGDVIGGLLTFSAAGRVTGGTGLVQSAVVDWKSTQSTANAAMDIFLFSDTTLSSTCTNASAFVLSASDWAKVVGVIHLTDTTVGNTTTHVQATGLALPYSTVATTLYGCAITRGAPVVGSTSDITVKLGLIEN